MVLRLCHPSNFHGLYEYRESEDLFYGPFGEEERRIIERHIKKSLVNTTVQIQSNRAVGVLDEVTNKYDGCIGMLQSNDSDLIMMMFEYPTEGDNLTQGIIAYDTSLVIGAPYTKVEGGPSAQLLDSFQSFSPGIWILCLLCPLILTIILKLRSLFRLFLRRKKRNDYTFYYTVAHCVRTGEIPSHNRVNRICYLCASIFSLVVLHYFCTLIKTQLVIIKDPDLFLSYQNIIDAKAAPYFIKGTAYSSFFSRKSAPPYRKKLWKYAVDSFGEENLQVDVDPISFFLIAIKTLRKEAVMIMDAVLMPVIPGTACPINLYSTEKLKEGLSVLSDPDRLPPLLETQDLTEEKKAYVIDFLRKNDLTLGKIPDIEFHVAIDPNEVVFSQGVLQSPFTSQQLQREVGIIFRRAIESGFSLKTMKNLIRFDLLRSHTVLQALFGKKMKSRSYLVEECFSETIVKPEIETHSLSFENLVSLAFLQIALMASSSLLLLVEVCYGRKFRQHQKTRGHFVSR